MKVLFISFEFPFIRTPQSIRWNALLWRIAEAGHEVSVYSPAANLSNEFFDKSFVHHPSINALALDDGHSLDFQEKKHAKLHKEKNSLFRSIKNRLKKSIPLDKSFVWALKSRKSLLKLANNGAYDVIVSSSPPFGSLLLGSYIKNKLGDRIRYIADLGDPWSFASDRKLSKLIFHLVAGCERRFLVQADWVLVTTRRTLEKYIELRIIAARQNASVLYQAADKLDELPQVLKYDLVYTGMFYEGLREPFNLYKACSIACRELTVAGPITTRFLPDAENANFVKFVGNLARPAAIEIQKSANILVFIDNRNSTQLPGKIFEYMATGRPIICIGSAENSPLRELDFNEYPIIFCDNLVEEIVRAIKAISTLPIAKNSISPHTWDERFRTLTAIVSEMIGGESVPRQ